MTSDEVRRALARDDLIMMATDADKAVGIVRQREALARRTRDEKSLFSVALEHYLRVAENEDEEWAIRAQAWKHAGVIVRFGDLVGIPATLPAGRRYTAAELHERSLRQLDGADATGEPRDLTLREFHRYRAARNLRLDGEFEAALGLARVTTDALNASGAEPHLAHLMYEVGAACIGDGRAGRVEELMRGREAYFDGDPRAARFPTRYRFDFIRAMAKWETGDKDAGAGFRSALDRVTEVATSFDDDRPAPEAGLGLLSVALTTAEYLARHGSTDQDHADAVAFGRQALRIADDVRGRWRVIARSRAPLAVVFQRIFGDIALLAADLGGDEAAELGLQVALSAKQTGFAARMRTGHLLMSPEVGRIIKDIIEVEAGPRTRMAIDHDTGERLERLRFELAEAVSPMLADTVLPEPADLRTIRTIIGTRCALDYLELTDSLATTWYAFRTLIRPGGRISFERFTPDPYYARFFTYAGERGNLATLLDLALSQPVEPDRDLIPAPAPHSEDRVVAGGPGAFDWRGLAENVLPADLRADLAAAGSRPIELVISAHSWLTLVPWPALRIAEDVRLVEKAIVTQTPALTCLHHERPPKVSGRALVRLVGTDESGVDVSAERAAWGLADGTAGVPLSACDIEPGRVPQPVRLLDDSLGRWGFVHFAAHGDGRGLAQHLDFPEEPLSFRHALSLRWPGSVLIASCHVGLVLNVTEAEPLNLVMGLLSGGARCVVAGIASVDDRGTGEAAGRIVRAIRERSVSLDVALHGAQLAAAADGAPERQWALLAAYTQ